MESTTLLACNKRYIVSALDDRVATRRTNDTLSLLKPDYLGHKGVVTHLAIHQPDNCYGTQDDWGRVVASSDVTNRVKVWLCDGEEEELMFARNMAEYVGYEKVTALAWTGDSKVAIGDAAGNFIVFNARFATSRYNRTVPKAITAIAPSQTDSHIHAVGYQDGSILLIRTNPTFQILFTNTVAHSAPIISLAWRPEFSTAKTYTEKDGKVHKSSAEDMTLLASCPSGKGEFRIWAWSSKTEKLTGFREEKKDGMEEVGRPQDTGALQWSRNGKVVQFVEGEVRIWDVKKLQIQSDLLIPSSQGIHGVAVDGHRGIIYTLTGSGVEKHLIPAKPTNPMASTPLPPPEPLQVATPAPSRSPSPPKPEHVSTPEPIVTPIDQVPDAKPLPAEPPLEQASSELSIDPTSKVKSIVRQFDEDPGLMKKRNNFIATAKAKHSYERRKRAVSNDSDLMPIRGRTDSPSPGPDAIAESRITSQRSGNTESQTTRQPSLFDIATSRIANYEHARAQNKPTESRIPTMSSSNIKNDRPSQERASISDSTREKNITPAKETKVIPPPEPSPSFKPIDRTIRQPNATPLAVTIPKATTSSNSSEYSESATVTPNHTISPSIERVQMDFEFLESPILGDAIATANFPVIEVQSKAGTTLEPIPRTNSGSLKPIHEETALNIVKKDSTPALNIVKSPQKSQFNVPAPTITVRSKETPISGVTSTPSSSSSSKLVEPTSSYEDLGGISMDDHDLQDDARSDTSVESMDTKPPSTTAVTPRPLVTIPDIPPSTPVTNKLENPNASPATIKSSPGSRASRIWAEKHGKNIHTQVVEYLSDGEEATPSPIFKPSTIPEPIRKQSVSDTSSDHLDSPTPYKNSLKDYDLFRGLTKTMSQASKEHLETVLSTKITQQNLCKTFFGYDNVKVLVQQELQYAQQQNIGLTELMLKLWLGLDIDDEALLKAILFGKNNGLSDALVLAIAPLAGTEVWESLMLWCTEMPSSQSKSDIPYDDLVKGNSLVKTHMYAGFLCYNGSWLDAMEMYRKSNMYREAILMALTALMIEDKEAERLVDTMKELFRNWGDQVATQVGDGLLVSMCFAASMMTFDSTAKSRRRSRSPEQESRSHVASNATKPSSSPVIPVIRTQKPSPTDTQSSLAAPKPRSAASESPQGRKWAELATFMRTQRDKGFHEIRIPKTVQFKDTTSPKSGSASPSLPLPVRPMDRSRPNSPAGRPIPSRRYTDDEDWSRPPQRSSPRDHMTDDERSYPTPRRPSLPGHSANRSPESDSSSGRKFHDVSSPLSFGARGLSIKPANQAGQNPPPPPVPVKAEKREKMRIDEREKMRGYGEEDKSQRRHDPNGMGLGIRSQGIRERLGRV